MLETRRFICPLCGREHDITANFVKGVSGFIITHPGEPDIFIDPSEPHKCKGCIDDMLDELLRNMNTK